VADQKAFFTNTRSPEDLPGMMAVLHGGRTYVPRVVHAEVGHLKAPVAGRRRPHAHDLYHIVLVTDGHGHFLIDGDLLPTSKGVLCLTSPRQRHCFLNELDEDTEYSEVSFALLDNDEHPLSLGFAEMMSAWLNRPCATVTHLYADAEMERALQDEITGIAQSGGIHDPDGEIWVNAALVRILLLLYRDAFRQQQAEDESDLKRVRDYLHDNYARKLTLKKLADIACLSPNYLSRRFKRLYGMTPINYQIHLRIAAACELLKTTEDPVKSIAQRAGFLNQYYFSRMFKRVVGVPPGRYRHETSA
jgi:AraC-like DNA-binding protein